jgi:hypothetical protein
MNEGAPACWLLRKLMRQKIQAVPLSSRRCFQKGIQNAARALTVMSTPMQATVMSIAMKQIVRGSKQWQAMTSLEQTSSDLLLETLSIPRLL